MGDNKIIITDRSRIESGWDCPRKRFWTYEYGGWGLTPGGAMPPDLAYGLAFHEGAEIIGAGHGLDLALAKARQWTDKIEGVTIDGLQKSTEYYSLAYGHLRTFQSQILPTLLDRYTVRGLETEIALPLVGPSGSEVLDLTRLDVALQDKETGYNYYVEYKTDTDPSDIGARMQYNLQFVLGVAALSFALREPVVGSIIIGVDKGLKRGPSPKERDSGVTGERRESPFTYAYSLDTGFSTEWRLEWTRNWKKSPVWSYMTHAEWYEKLTSLAPDVAREQFVISQPLMWEKADFDRMARQVIGQEKWIDACNQTLSYETPGSPTWWGMLDDFFPMNRKNCRNDGGYKRVCPFAELCHGGKGDAPLDWGYKWRDENHPLEATIRTRPPSE